MVLLNPSTKISLKAGEERVTPAMVDLQTWPSRLEWGKGRKGRNRQKLSLSTKSVCLRKGKKVNKENSCEQLKSSTSTGAKCSCSNEMHTWVPRRLTSCSHCEKDCRGRQYFKQLFTMEKSGSPQRLKKNLNLYVLFCHRKTIVQGQVWMVLAAHVCSFITTWLRHGGHSVCCLLPGCGEEIYEWNSQS